MLRALCVLALLASACATNGVAPAPIFPVRATLVISSPSDWQGTLWSRVSDHASGGQVYVLVADGNRACVVPPEVWIRVHPGDLHACQSGWRAPRMRQAP